MSGLSSTNYSSSVASSDDEHHLRLHGLMLSFVFKNRFADRLHHFPIAVWQQFLNEHRGDTQIGPIRKTPAELMHLFVRTVLPSVCRKLPHPADHQPISKAEQEYFRFLELSLKSYWDRHAGNDEEAMIGMAAVHPGEFGASDQPIVASSQTSFNEQTQQHKLHTVLNSVDLSDMVMSYQVASPDERQMSILIPSDETRCRVQQLRDGSRLRTINETDELPAVIEYVNAVQLKLHSCEKQIYTKTTVPAAHFQARTSCINFDICRSHDVDHSPLTVMPPRPRLSPVQPPHPRSTSSKLTPASQWRRPKYVTLTPQQIINILATLPETQRRHELRFLERKAIRGTPISRADRRARNAMPISPISGMLHNTPRRRVAMPEVGRRRFRRTGSTGPQLGRMSAAARGSPLVRLSSTPLRSLGSSSSSSN